SNEEPAVHRIDLRLSVLVVFARHPLADGHLRAQDDAHPAVRMFDPKRQLGARTRLQCFAAGRGDDQPQSDACTPRGCSPRRRSARHFEPAGGGAGTGGCFLAFSIVRLSCSCKRRRFSGVICPGSPMPGGIGGGPELVIAVGSIRLSKSSIWLSRKP